MKTARFLAAAAALALAACTSIPKQNLDAYVANFNTAKTTAQDMYLAAQVRAEKSNDGTSSGRALLASRTRAVNARLAALEMIDQYNNALVKLATGTDSAGVKENLEGLSSNLKGFGIEPISALVGSAAPYLNIITTAITLIDNAIKAERFAEAVAAAQGPIQQIIGMLVLDADALEVVKNEPLRKTRNQVLGKLTDIYFNFASVANSLVADPALSSSIANLNSTLARLNVDVAVNRPGPLVHVPPLAPPATPKGAKPKPKPGVAVPRAANADEIALLKSLQHQANELIDEYNRLGETIKTQHALIEEYKKTLEACKASLTQLNNAVKDGKRAETLAFAMNVLNLRKAYIAVREAK
jgi:hypothetical protein